jgi:hypothetical protein
MRSVLALCMIIALCASANAAARKPQAQSRQGITGRTLAVTPGAVTPSGARVFRDNSVPGGWRTDHDDPPAYDDPSKRSRG